MDELNSEQIQTPSQIIERPASVTVFGVLNCVFGGLGLLCAPCGKAGWLAAMYETMEATKEYLILNIAGGVISLGFSACLLTMGIGLLMMKNWARKGTVIYSIANIICAFLLVGMNIAALALHWITMPPQAIAGYIGSMCGGVVGLIYPVLLLIFMNTAKVKRAFAAIGR